MRRRNSNDLQSGVLPSSRDVRKSFTRKLDTLTWIIILLSSCFISFYGGIWMAWTIHSPTHDHQDCSNNKLDAPSSSSDCTNICLNAVIGGQGELATLLDGKLDVILAEKIDKAVETVCPSRGGGSKGSSTYNKRFDPKLTHFANGMVSINRQDMFETYDFGMVMDPGADREDVLMIYDSKSALPSNKEIAYAAQYGGDIPHTDANTATENCDTMNVMFIKNPGHRKLRQCVALVGGQYQSYHIQKWMRVVGSGAHGKVDKNAPLRITGRMTKSDGYDELMLPKPKNLNMHKDIMLNYFSNLPQIQSELSNILRRIAIDNTVVVSTVNAGQSELLMNFVCSSRAKGFDLKNFIVFPTDKFSKELAEGMGIATYFAEQLMGGIPTQEAARYGDTTFGQIMMAKVICVHLVSELGYDILFQDVDVIWYKDPLDYFHDKKSSIADFDVYFQDDGNRQERYAPYSANSGFYYIRNNERSKTLFRTMLYSGDLIFACRSHQQILITLLAEANSLTGLKVKVLSRDEDDFPGGYHYHMRQMDYMKTFVHQREKIDPYIFHMSWTLNKDDKLKFMRQMGMWHINDQCLGKDAHSISQDGEDVVSQCCSAEPNFSCHYRDKPSIRSCADAQPKDKNGRDWFARSS